MNDFNQAVIDEFRANHGKVGGGFDGVPVILLTTTGAKSGRTKVNPLVCQPGADGTLYVFASAAGAPRHPAWYHNLVAHPTVTVESGDEVYEAHAVPVTGAERDRIYARQVELVPGFGEYEVKAANRTIPVVALSRA